MNYRHASAYNLIYGKIRLLPTASPIQNSQIYTKKIRITFFFGDT